MNLIQLTSYMPAIYSARMWWNELRQQLQRNKKIYNFLLKNDNYLTHILKDFTNLDIFKVYECFAKNARFRWLLVRIFSFDGLLGNVNVTWKYENIKKKHLRKKHFNHLPYHLSSVAGMLLDSWNIVLL